MYQLVVFITLTVVHCSHGYSLGAPNTPTVCKNMIPNHNVSAMNDLPPFSFTLNATEYSPGDVIRVFLDSSGEWFMEGLLVQARTADCQDDVTAVGTFSVRENEDFLKPLACFNKPASALTHYTHLHIYNRTFYWTAPSTAVGHVFLRATIVRKETIFWTNVHSTFIFDRSNSTRAGLTKDATCGAESNRVTMVMVLGISMMFLLIKN